MIDKNHKEREHIQGIEKKGHTITQIVPYSMILYEKCMDREKTSGKHK